MPNVLSAESGPENVTCLQLNAESNLIYLSELVKRFSREHKQVFIFVDDIQLANPILLRFLDKLTTPHDQQSFTCSDASATYDVANQDNSMILVTKLLKF